jgi:hypothetical protein
MRTFSLNSPKFYEAVREPRDPWGWGPRLSRDPRWGDRSDPLSVSAETEAEAGDAVRGWMAQLQTGRRD